MKNSIGFENKKPIIACIHLLPLPGSPLYSGSIQKIIDFALTETEIFKKYNIHGLIVENFRDVPFFPNYLPPETIAAFSIITHEIKKSFQGPVGVNALRNDALGALAVAHSAEAQFIRVNIHTGAAITDQGLVQGEAHNTLRKRAMLCPEILIFADVAVKHATPIGTPNLVRETKDTVERGLADAVIVSGDATGATVNTKDLIRVKENTSKPVIIGSGTTTENLKNLYPTADGFIVGSYFKKDGLANNAVEDNRVAQFMDRYNSIVQDGKKI